MELGSNGEGHMNIALSRNIEKYSSDVKLIKRLDT
ncbi:MAG: hypothetical protein ACI828_000736 [Flavobacteriales bacterium]|jgi:hypothetical protein